jgi:hypothetical protein
MLSKEAVTEGQFLNPAKIDQSVTVIFEITFADSFTSAVLQEKKRITVKDNSSFILKVSIF